MELNREKLLTLFFLFGNICLIRSQGLRDGCSLRIRKHYKSIAYEKTNPDCTSGKIWWNYPSGKVVVDFQYELGHKPFLLCMILKEDPSGIKFYDITEGEHKARKMPYSKKGFYTCVPDLNGRVSLLMDGPFFPITYLYMIQYRLLVDWEPTKRLSKI